MTDATSGLSFTFSENKGMFSTWIDKDTVA